MPREVVHKSIRMGRMTACGKRQSGTYMRRVTDKWDRVTCESCKRTLQQPQLIDGIMEKTT